jgi:RND family efflux transporter MFP subunit
MTWRRFTRLRTAAPGGLLLAVLPAAGCGHAPAAPTAETRPAAPAAVAVTVEPATPRPVRRTVHAVGTLYGREEVAVTTKVDGRIVRIRHDVGDTVKPGDTLLEIDPTDYELAAAQGRRNLELELAKLGLRELPAGEVDFAQLPTVAKAAAKERNAGSQRDRMRRLSGGAASAEDRDSMEKEYAVAVAEYRQAVLDARATLAAARFQQAALDTLRQKILDCKVVVPTPSDAAGGAVEFAVCTRGVSEGEMVRTMFASETATLFKLVIDHPLKLKATVPDRHRAEVKVGQPARLRVESHPGQTFAGTVARVNPSVDTASRTFQVEVQVPNDDRALHPGSFAKVEILTHTDPAAVTVPEEAVIRFAGVTKLFAVKDGAACEVPVRTGPTLELTEHGRKRAWVEVTGELPAGTPVVTSGHSRLAQGTAVRVREGSKTNAGE